MNTERYTQRAQGIIQSAQMFALREGHQRLTPEHIAKSIAVAWQNICGPQQGIRAFG